MERDRLVGHRLALAGAVLSFGEWIGMAIAPSLPTEKLGPAQPRSSPPGLFARWIAWLGLVAGALLVAGGIESSAAPGSSGAPTP